MHLVRSDHLRSHDKDGGHTNGSVTPEHSPDTRKPHGVIFYRTGVMGNRSLHCENRHFRPFLTCDL